jgi:peptide/nickel transport system permease protein
MSEAAIQAYEARLRRRRHSVVLAPLVRLACTPLALALLLVGTGWRTLVLVLRGVRHGKRPDEGLAEGWRRWKAYVGQGARYLLWRTDEIPGLDARVRAPGEGLGPWLEVKRRLRHDRVAMLSFLGMVLYLYLAVLAATGCIARGYDQEDRNADYRPPTLSLTSFEVGAHPLGTDLQGRDVWKRTVHGAKNALWIGALSAALACLIGVVLGAVAGWFGGWVDEVIVWFYATLESIPYLLLMLALSFVFQKNPTLAGWYRGTVLAQGLGISLGLFTIVVAVGLTFWVSVCRIVRGEYIKLRDRDFVTAARALGVPTRRILFKHVLPNVMHLVLISFSLLFMSAIKFEVILSFLGLGMEEGEASWGRMISEAKVELVRANPVWWQITSATVAMFLLLLCVNLFTDALRDALDPRLRD